MEKQVVIITGASSGIGRAVAWAAARQGYRVVLFARREDRLRELAQRIEDLGGEALVVTGDVTKLDDQRRLVAETVAKYGRIDVLVNNAGLPLPDSFSESSPEDLQNQWGVNVTSLATLTRIALPPLKQSGGLVVNVGSLISRVAVPGMGNYGPTKIAVAGLTNALRRELAPQGVHVSLVEPGPISTEFTQRAGGNKGEYSSISRPATEVARQIVRLFKHPRTRISIPGWMGAILSPVGAIAHVASPLVDAVFYRRGGR